MSMLPERLRVVDPDGTEVAVWDNPNCMVPEIEADPADWPTSDDIDGWRWEIGAGPDDEPFAVDDPPIDPGAPPLLSDPSDPYPVERPEPEPEPFEPSEADRSFWGPHTPADDDADWAEFSAWCDRLDALEAIHGRHDDERELSDAWHALIR